MAEFAKVYEIDKSWTEYDKSVAKCQLLNYGCIYVDQYGCPIDNDFDLEMRYQEESVKKCCICGRKLIGYGNNPQPVMKEGRCCDDCNNTVVLRARIKEVMKHVDAYYEEENSGGKEVKKE